MACRSDDAIGGTLYLAPFQAVLQSFIQNPCFRVLSGDTSVDHLDRVNCTNLM
jgi:hypothetical protein